MKTIRSNCFETNSSSTHSITIDHQPITHPDNISGVHVERGEFGWEFRTIDSANEKASYFWTLAQDNPALRNMMENIAECTGMILVNPPEGSWHYVDHGWEHYADFVDAYPELLTIEGIIHFITNPNCEIETGNDNC